MCTICLSEINNTQVGDTHDIDIVIPTHNSIEYSDTYSKTLGHLQEYYRDEPALKDNGDIIDFPNDNNNNILFKFKQQIIGQTGNNGARNTTLKYLSKFSRTLEMPLVNCGISLMLTWSNKLFLAAGTAAIQETTFAITDSKFYVPVVTLSTPDNIKLLKQLKSHFKRTINWNKYQSKISEKTQNRY